MYGLSRFLYEVLFWQSGTNNSEYRVEYVQP